MSYPASGPSSGEAGNHLFCVPSNFGTMSSDDDAAVTTGRLTGAKLIAKVGKRIKVSSFIIL